MIGGSKLSCDLLGCEPMLEVEFKCQLTFQSLPGVGVAMFISNHLGCSSKNHPPIDDELDL